MLVAVPASPVAGQRVQLRVENAPVGGVDYRWDLTGRGAYRLDTGSTPRAGLRVLAPGAHRVAVRVSEPGWTRVVTGIVLVRHRRAGGGQHAAHQSQTTRIGPTRTRAARPLPSHPVGHAAGDPGVTIADFQFTPATTTVHVGDAITWTNHGPSAHTATAHAGSFDTSVLQKGQSASHTFTQPGTFTYFCRIHPFMHGAIVVLAAATKPTPSAAPSGGSRGSSATAASSAAATSSRQTLPTTGVNEIALVLSGLLLSGIGVSLRRALRGSPPGL